MKGDYLLYVSFEHVVGHIGHEWKFHLGWVQIYIPNIGNEHLNAPNRNT